MAQKYDPSLIIQSADDKLAEGDLEGGQMVFQSALLDWVDDAREGGPQQHNYESLQLSITTLWLAYISYLTKSKKWKSSFEAYEQAVVCPVAGNVGRIWLEYARYAEDRQKLNTAQNVYIRALVGDAENPPAVQEEQDRDLLWHEFLEMMQKNNADLTLRELQDAVMAEHKANLHPEAVLSLQTAPSTTDSPDEEHPPTKRARTDEPRSHVVTAESVDTLAKAMLQDLTSIPQEMQAAWMIRDGNDIPQVPEVMLFEPSPPKLSDTSGKELLGAQLALALNQRLLEPSGSILLETCRGLWTLSALKEQEVRDAIQNLDEMMLKENDRLETNLEARLAVAGHNIHAVQQMNHNERMNFQNACGQQRKSLLASMAWEMRKLLCIQQTVLTKLKIPGFNGPSVDDNTITLHASICAYLHSCFYLRKRIGTDPHVAMLRKQVTKLEAEIQNHQGDYSEILHQHQQAPVYGQQMPQPPSHNFFVPPPPPPPQYPQPYGGYYQT